MGNMIAGVLRALTPAVVAWLVAKGWFTPNDASNFMQYLIDAVPILVGIVAALSSIRSNMLKHQIAQVASNEEVKRIVVEAPEATAAKDAAGVGTVEAAKVTPVNTGHII